MSKENEISIQNHGFFPNLLTLMHLMRNYKLSMKMEALCIIRTDEFGLRIVAASSDWVDVQFENVTKIGSHSSWQRF
jgi:hypothetical protein